MSEEAFVVTRGEYSDYGIVAVFANRGDAEAFVEKGNGIEGNGDRPWDAYTLEVWPLLTGPVQRVAVWHINRRQGEAVVHSTEEWDLGHLREYTSVGGMGMVHATALSRERAQELYDEALAKAEAGAE